MNLYSTFDDAYQDILRRILREGIRSKNRTGVDTLSVFGHAFSLDISESFPLLTLKDMSGGVWNSVIQEFLWYLSGEHHIRNLTKETSIWDSWADDEGNLSFAYGRFWRRFPVPDLRDTLPGERWVLGDIDAMNTFVMEETTPEGYRLVFDQLAYILHTLATNPQSRRMVLTAWHPANAAVANPPACHTMAVFNVEDDGDQQKLNCHLTMRSNDVGLGLGFNVAQYSLLTYVLAKCSGMTPGKFNYSGVDVHLYVGDSPETKAYDQLSYAKEILKRTPLPPPTLEIKQDSLDALQVKDILLKGYTPLPALRMKCVP